VKKCDGSSANKVSLGSKQTSHDARGTIPTPSLSYNPMARYSDLKVLIAQRLYYQVWKKVSITI
jgi:hypothetical protein